MTEIQQDSNSQDPTIYDPISTPQKEGMVLDRQLTLEEIYTSHRQKIVRYLSRLVGEHEAEDLTQEVFLKIGRALKNLWKARG